MFLRAKSKRVDIDTSVGVASVVLVRLDEVKVSTLTLREAVLAVKLELTGYDGILTPAVHVKRGLGKYESTGIRYTRVLDGLAKTSTRTETKMVHQAWAVTSTAPASWKRPSWSMKD